MIEATETTQQIDKATVELNAWASVWWHRIYGALGYPKIEECLIDPYFVNGWAEPAVIERKDRKSGEITYAPSDTYPKILDDADETIYAKDSSYQISRDKYKSTGLASIMNDQRSKASKLLVDRVLVDIGWPEVLIGLLLWLYPTEGSFAVNRGENPYRTYRPPCLINMTTGKLFSHNTDRSFDAYLKHIEREFLKELRAKMRRVA